MDDGPECGVHGVADEAPDGRQGEGWPVTDYWGRD